MKTEYDKRILRLIRIMTEIRTVPRQTVADMLKKLGISKSQFYKDREMLAGLGFEFEYSRNHQKMVVTKDRILPVENLTFSEQMALVMALRHLSASGDHILTYEGLKAAQKLSLSLPSPFRESLFEGMVLNKGFGCRQEIMDRVQKAIEGKWRVILLYQRPEQNSPSEELMVPYHIFFKRRALYTEGYSYTEEGIRTYRMNRIQEVRFETQGFAVREDYDFGRRYLNAFSAFPGDSTEHVKVRFSAKCKPFITESLWHHSQKITEEKNGFLIFEVDVAYPREVMWWAFFWGPGAEILEPQWLRKEAIETIRRMGRVYDNGE